MTLIPTQACNVRWIRVDGKAYHDKPWSTYIFLASTQRSEDCTNHGHHIERCDKTAGKYAFQLGITKGIVKIFNRRYHGIAASAHHCSHTKAPVHTCLKAC